MAAQETLGEHFPGRSGNPAVIIADAGRAAEVTAAARSTEGVASAGAVSASARPGAGEPLAVDGRVRIDATLEAAADSDAAKETVERLRARVHAVPGADALVGGYTAQQYGFVFLVALGVDYNIFLMSRAREEALEHGNRRGVLRGLTTTGGVITSAGVVLAATFAALMVIPPGVPGADRVHRRLRGAARHARGALAAGARAGDRHRAPGVVAERLARRKPVGAGDGTPSG